VTNRREFLAAGAAVVGVSRVFLPEDRSEETAGEYSFETPFLKTTVSARSVGDRPGLTSVVIKDGGVDAVGGDDAVGNVFLWPEYYMRPVFF